MPSAWAQNASSVIDETISSLDDPFDVSLKAPEIIELFLQGLAEAKKQLEAAQVKPVKEKSIEPVVVKPAALPKLEGPIKPKKLDIPPMAISGIVYDVARPQAIINGKVVSVGDRVDGVSVVKIQKGRVTLRQGDIDFILKFNNE